MAEPVCEVTWGLHYEGLVAECSDCTDTHTVTTREDLDAWADAHRKAAHPWAERVRIVRVMD